jgi:hypothetical protein
MSNESTAQAGTKPTNPDWDSIQLPPAHIEHLKQLQDDQTKLRRITAVGLAIIHYMKSDLYADTQGEDLEYAFFLLAQQEDI